MPQYSLTHLADHVLLRDLASLVAQDRATTAAMLAHLAEVDARKLYLPAAYPSMFAYCVGELRLSEDAAFKRLRAARAARQFPAIFAAVANGRLSLSTVGLLAAHLTPDNADELLVASAHKTKAEVEIVVAQRFPRPDIETRLTTVPSTPLSESLAPGPVVPIGAREDPMQTEPLWPRATLAPLAPQRFALQVTIAEETRERLRYAQELLGHAVPSGDVAEVLDRALQALIGKLEQRRFARRARAPRADGPGTGGRSVDGTAQGAPARDPHGKRDANAKRNPNGTRDPHCMRDPDGKRDARECDGAPRGRYLPAAVRNTVWRRDHGQCTFVSERGKRCAARTRLEFDHIEPVARGGNSSAGQLRLRCRAHNQFAAELVFGPSYMEVKRSAARRRARNARIQEGGEVRVLPTKGSEQSSSVTPLVPEPVAARPGSKAASPDATNPSEDVIPWLRALGFRADEARRGAGACTGFDGATFERRVRHALSALAPPGARRSGCAVGSPGWPPLLGWPPPPSPRRRALASCRSAG